MVVQLANEKLGKLRHLLFLRDRHRRYPDWYPEDAPQADLEAAVSAANAALQMIAGAPRTDGRPILNGPTPQLDASTVTMEQFDAVRDQMTAGGM
jgi:hypothetical protein